MRSLIEEYVMRRHSWEGDLSLATSRPGVIVRCTQVPGDRFKKFWENILNKQAFHFLPIVKERYIVRANVTGPQGSDQNFMYGLLLSQWPDKTPLVNVGVSLNGGISIGEPFFPFNCFDFVSGGRS